MYPKHSPVQFQSGRQIKRESVFKLICPELAGPETMEGSWKAPPSPSWLQCFDNPVDVAEPASGSLTCSQEHRPQGKVCMEGMMKRLTFDSKSIARGGEGRRIGQV